MQADDQSGHRGVLGIGTGISGLEALGVQRQKGTTALREAITLMRRLFDR